MNAKEDYIHHYLYGGMNNISNLLMLLSHRYKILNVEHLVGEIALGSLT